MVACIVHQHCTFFFAPYLYSTRHTYMYVIPSLCFSVDNTGTTLIELAVNKRAKKLYICFFGSHLPSLVAAVQSRFLFHF